MKAGVQYNDFVGTAAADISDFLGSKYGNHLISFQKYFSIDETRFRVVGISIYGIDSDCISLFCVDKQRSTEEKDYLVKMSIDIDNKKEILNFLFKRLHVVLHSRSDEKYPGTKFYEEINYSDYHETDK
ncbi:MAG: hypothetical protein ACOVOQ_06955 [Flavobacterium sp.]